MEGFWTPGMVSAFRWEIRGCGWKREWEPFVFNILNMIINGMINKNKNHAKSMSFLLHIGT